MRPSISNVLRPSPEVGAGAWLEKEGLLGLAVAACFRLRGGSLVLRSIESGFRQPWVDVGEGGKMAAVAAGGLVGKGRDISLAALQRHDPYINRIVDVASQVALYTFGHRANEWVRADATGPCRQGEGGDGFVRLWAPEPSEWEETLTFWRWMEVDGGDRGLRPKLWQLDPHAGGLGEEGSRSEKPPEVGEKT